MWVTTRIIDRGVSTLSSAPKDLCAHIPPPHETGNGLMQKRSPTYAGWPLSRGHPCSSRISGEVSVHDHDHENGGTHTGALGVLTTRTRDPRPEYGSSSPRKEGRNTTQTSSDKFGVFVHIFGDHEMAIQSGINTAYRMFTQNSDMNYSEKLGQWSGMAVYLKMRSLLWCSL